ncbi:LOW QUALITY PROTEIN: ecto-NOX disulfide-thiol exchanger 2 [Discoglossus pictus]
MSLSDPSAWATAMTNLGITLMDMRSPPDFAGLGVMNPLILPTPASTPVVKEIIHCASCTLFPPNPNLPPPATRARPPGCKTIFVGGLPENAGEHTLREVFGPMGEILSVRRGGKSYCHIRFSEEESVERALYLSGYRIRLGSSSDRKDTGHFHVDYAQARDDMYEWESQRALAREERHRREWMPQRLRPPSPPPVIHYCEHEGNIVAERLKDSTTFKDAVHALITWMERGEVNRQSANSFYSMISVYASSVRLLQSETQEHKRQLEEAKEAFKCGLNNILQHLNRLFVFFHSASKQRVRDHLGKAQRKNLNCMREQAREVHKRHSEELLGIRCEQEMEMSEEEMEGTEQRRSPNRGEIDWLREENENLLSQLDILRKELNQMKEFSLCIPQESSVHKSLGNGNSLHNPLQKESDPYNLSTQDNSPRALPVEGNCPQELPTEGSHHHNSETEGNTLHVSPVQQIDLQETFLFNFSFQLEKIYVTLPHHKETCMNPPQDQVKESIDPTSHDSLNVREERLHTSIGKIIWRDPCNRTYWYDAVAYFTGIISTFLHVHPCGASTEYICSYLQQLDRKVVLEVQRLLLSHPRLFYSEFHGIGATLEKRWKFCGFQQLPLT